jgi:hypothetical protein
MWKVWLGVGYFPLESGAKERRRVFLICVAVGVDNLLKALKEGSKPDDYMAYDGSTALVMAAIHSRPIWKTLTWRTICFSAEMPYMVCTPLTVGRCHRCGTNRT